MEHNEVSEWDVLLSFNGVAATLIKAGWDLPRLSMRRLQIVEQMARFAAGICGDASGTDLHISRKGSTTI